MAEFHVHAAAEVRGLEHGTTPVRSRNLHQYGLRAELGMAPDPEQGDIVRYVAAVAIAFTKEKV